MTWWSRHDDAQVLAVVMVDGDSHDPFSASAFRAAARRLERGVYEQRWQYAGRRVELVLSAGDGFTPNAAVASWNRLLPDDLYLKWADSTDLQFKTVGSVELSGGRHVALRVPAILDGRIAIPAGALEARLRLGPDWAPLFPGASLANAIVARDSLRATISLADDDLDRARLDVETMVRETIRLVACPDELPLWMLYLAEDGDEALAAAAAETGLRLTSSEQLLASPEFREAISRPLGVVVSLGWIGVMWLQLHRELTGRSPARRCQYPGCTDPKTVGARRYCSTHGAQAGREHARDRQRRRRR